VPQPVIGHRDEVRPCRDPHRPDGLQAKFRLERAACKSPSSAVRVLPAQADAGLVTLQRGAQSLADSGNPIEEDLAAAVPVNVRELNERLMPRIPAWLQVREVLAPADLAAGVKNRQHAAGQRPTVGIAGSQQPEQDQRQPAGAD